ncbi:Putative AC transposase [Linum perenne]
MLKSIILWFGSFALEDGNATSNDLDFELFLTQRKKARTTAVVTELDNYLNEDVLFRSSDFDILIWWKLSRLKYPILQAIARDVLAIPVTSVAFESTFSSGGRLLNPTVILVLKKELWSWRTTSQLWILFPRVMINQDQGGSQVPTRSTTDYNLDDID